MVAPIENRRNTMGIFEESPELRAEVISLDRYMRRSEGWVRDCYDMVVAAKKDGLFWVSSDFLGPMIVRKTKAARQVLKRLMTDPNIRIEDLQRPDASFQTGPTVGAEKPQALLPPWPKILERSGQHPSTFREIDGKTRWMEPYCPDGTPVVSPTDPGIESFNETLESWSKSMWRITSIIGEMLAFGLELSTDTFVRNWLHATHFCAPTITDLSRFEHGQCVAGVHADLSEVTLHGPPTHGGLIVWTYDGKRHRVGKPPIAHAMLLQIGMGLEHRVGGQKGGGLFAGIHEVVATGTEGLRIAFPFFIEGQLNMPLAVLPPWRNDETLAMYPDTTFGAHMARVLKAISLKPEGSVLFGFDEGSKQ